VQQFGAGGAEIRIRLLWRENRSQQILGMRRRYTGPSAIKDRKSLSQLTSGCCSPTLIKAAPRPTRT